MLFARGGFLLDRNPGGTRKIRCLFIGNHTAPQLRELPADIPDIAGAIIRFIKLGAGKIGPCQPGFFQRQGGKDRFGKKSFGKIAMLQFKKLV